MLKLKIQLWARAINGLNAERNGKLATEHWNSCACVCVHEINKESNTHI